MDKYTLEEITIVAGDYLPLEFEVFDDARSEMASLDGYEVFCAISPFGQNDFVVIEKQGEKIEQGKFIVAIPSNETINLCGKFVYQPVLKASERHQCRPAQGILTILPANI